MAAMFMYGKTAANGIAVMSYLASDPRRRAGSDEISRAREMSRPLAAKLLTQLAAAGLVAGTPGPGGGYRLAKPAGRISLLQIVELFEQTVTPSVCPFGRSWCGKGDPCPLHDTILELVEANRRFLEETRLSVFVGAEPARPKRGARGSKRRRGQ